jgi:hypothetical protein
MGESKLTLDDLNSLPVLVIELDRESRITSVHGSSALQSFLGKVLLDSKPADTVFLDEWTTLSQLQREMILELGKSIGDPVLVGELLATQLPSTVTRKSGPGSKAVRFQLCYGFPEESGAIKTILIQMTPLAQQASAGPSDGTESLIEVRTAQERADAELLLQLHRCEAGLLAIVEKEVSGNIQTLASMISSGDIRSLDEYRKIFHSVKGATRQHGLLAFSKIALEAEHAMKDAIHTGAFAGGLPALQDWLKRLESEWSRIRRFKALIT